MTDSIETLPFGRTGHMSTRTLFGAAGIGGMKQSKADEVLEILLEYGVNHIDTAASYGESEVRLAPFLAQHRDAFFLATKTGDRTRDAARDSIHRSLERMGVDHVDLIQFHNLTDDSGWETAMGPGGALEAALEARDEGLVRFIGVTGHGTAVAEMHLRSLDRFDFDSVLLPRNYMLMQDERYQGAFDELYARCESGNVAMQIIKSIARRRWRDDDDSPRYSWYEPIRDRDALRRAVFWTLARPGVFLNTSSDATLLRATLDAAREFGAQREGIEGDTALKADVAGLDLEPLFVRGVTDTI